MREYFWKIAGGDPSILENSGKDSQSSFYSIGLLLVLINVLIFSAFFGLFWGVFSTLFVALFGASLLTFLISTIYRLNLMSLEPPTLPIKSEGGSLVLSYIIRISTIALFAVFASKCLETSLFGSYVDELLRNKIINSTVLSRYKYETSEMFVNHMSILNETYPVVWIMTLLMVCLFVYPIYLKFQLRKRFEYFSIKEKRDIRLVKEQFELFENELKKIYRRTYAEYPRVVTKVDDQKTFNEKGKYAKTDFYNQKEAQSIIVSGNSEDFIYLEDWN